MNYKFPLIKNISDVLPVIKDRKEFIVVDKGYHTIINYVLQGNDTFPDVIDNDASILRECRGITFCSITGDVVARKLHKFFNLNEREETQLENIDFSKPHYIAEKLDGSMLVPVKNPGGEIVFHSKMGFTDIASRVTSWVHNNHKEYLRLAKWAIEYGFTLIFEWCSRKNRIVIDYPEDRLVLLHMRRNSTGNYTPRWYLEEISKRFGVELVKAAVYRKGTNQKYFKNQLEIILSKTNEEGYVITFEDGHMVKVKNSWYLQLHRTKDDIATERKVVNLILENSIDDLKSLLDTNDHIRVENYEQDFLSIFNVTVETFEDHYQLLTARNYDRKRFALEVAPDWNKLSVALMFKLYDGKDCTAEFIKMLKNSVNNNKKFDEVKKSFFPDIKYKEMWDQ